MTDDPAAVRLVAPRSAAGGSVAPRSVAEAAAPPTALPATALQYGRPARRRRAVPALLVLALALAVALATVHHNLGYFRVTSGSMEPTLRVGQRVAADPGLRSPQVGDIVLFHPPAGADPTVPECGISSEGQGFAQACGVPTSGESRSTFIKRVVAGPGDLVAVVGGHVVRNGRAQHEPFAAACDDEITCNFPTPVRVPAGDYFVLGDNRGNSDDSRFWGPVPGAWITATVVRCAVLATFCRPMR